MGFLTALDQQINSRVKRAEYSDSSNRNAGGKLFEGFEDRGA